MITGYLLMVVCVRSVVRNLGRSCIIPFGLMILTVMIQTLVLTLRASSTNARTVTIKKKIHDSQRLDDVCMGLMVRSYAIQITRLSWNLWEIPPINFLF